MKKTTYERLSLTKTIGGGQALGTLDDGRTALVWGGLPGEDVTILLTKKKSSYVEGIVTEVHTASPERVAPADPDSYLSTSPWQIMSFDAEQRHKAELIHEAFMLHGVTLPSITKVYTDGVTQRYRNKVEFSWYGDATASGETLDLAFFRRGTKGKIVVHDSILLPEPMLELAKTIRDDLGQLGISARQLKTLLIRSDQKGLCVWQLYTKDENLGITQELIDSWPAQGGEVIYSNPKSPASVITTRELTTGNLTLTDTILDKTFQYVAEGFFQVNIPVYEQALRDMREWVLPHAPTIDMYAGVGSIGLTIGRKNTTLVELNEAAVGEMHRNIESLGNSAQAVLSSSEQALEYITSDACVIVDPPRAGLHADVIAKILETKPARLIYLSCNPVTQARDVALLLESYKIIHHKGYNFFPRTPHIENLVVLDLL